jgi:hypothetical protein
MLPLTFNTAPVIVSEAVPDKVIFPATLQLEARLIAPEDEEIPLAGQVPSGVLLAILTKLALFAANAAVDSGGAMRLSQGIAIIEASVAFFTLAKLDEIIKNCVILDNPFCNSYYN